MFWYARKLPIWSCRCIYQKCLFFVFTNISHQFFHRIVLFFERTRLIGTKWQRWSIFLSWSMDYRPSSEVFIFPLRIVRKRWVGVAQVVPNRWWKVKSEKSKVFSLLTFDFCGRENTKVAKTHFSLFHLGEKWAKSEAPLFTFFRRIWENGKSQLPLLTCGFFFFL